MPTTDKRTALLNLGNAGLPQGGVPAAFFLHFDKGFRSGQAAIDKHVEFFRFTEMDLVKVQFEVEFPRLEMKCPSDWAKIPALSRAMFENQIEVVHGLVESLGKEALVVLTLYSPFMIAGEIGGAETLRGHMEEDLDAVRPGIERITEGLLDFVRACIKVGVDGFYHSTQGGENRRFSDPALFDQGVKPYDLVVMEEINRRCPFNILHICDYHRAEYGGYDDLTQFFDYPGHIVNCSLEGMNPSLISTMFRRPFMGGMDRRGVLSTGTESAARTAARSALSEASDRFILGADCTVPRIHPGKTSVPQ
jgi:uroporphyrinogen decarboxylase